ncbi:isocitrate/isopropylmalate family dehydrogenase [Acidiplasma cupricumulans]|uniref:isocitrate/isopropylmalate family dehydrogenase n=1 Tax=Acidiplasma cupricumulans TaxID=312540 RepID=UPI0007817A9C|nr:isocitrate/isopropylmalate family dehydrogenase [Acidiplasma cupricumulans]
MGDGIGPEIMNAAIKIINKLHENFGLNINPVEYDIGAVTLDNGKWDLDHILDEARKYKAILKAPMGDPKLRNTGGTEKALDVILSLRFDLDLYANVRPVRLLPGVESPLKSYNNPDSINYTIIRENSEGLYSSHFGGLVLRDELAIDNQTITRKGTERISRFAFELAKKTKGSPKDGKKSVVCVDKSNVLRSFAFFRKIFLRFHPDMMKSLRNICMQMPWPST